jgi:5-(carboxyamino)imidazole ribonucleotide mutase
LTATGSFATPNVTPAASAASFPAASPATSGASSPATSGATSPATSGASSPAASAATSAPQVGSAPPAPLVGIVMGSDSDWPVMRAAAQALDEFAVPYEADVVSAHRMPRDMIEYGSSAEARGLRVIIAGAGGAAHLPGMLASVTPLPVIGVPVPLANLGGLDSLLSIVQMPAGIPVATVAVGGARNAGLLAVRILAAAENSYGRELRAALVLFAEQLAATARAKGAALRDRPDGPA